MNTLIERAKHFDNIQVHNITGIVEIGLLSNQGHQIMVYIDKFIVSIKKQNQFIISILKLFDYLFEHFEVLQFLLNIDLK